MPCSPSPSVSTADGKMESTEALYNDARFEEIKKEVSSYIKKNGSVEPSTKMARLKASTCLRLWSILTPTFPTDKPLHLPLKDANKIDANYPGIAIVFAPVNLTADVKSVEMHQEAGGRARTQKITAQVIMLNHFGQISNGYNPVLECHTAHIACEFSGIKEKVFHRSGKSTEDYRKSIKSDDDTIVFLIPPKPLW